MPITGKDGVPLYLVYLAFRIHRQLEKALPQYSTVDGTSNVWICKPSYNARGHGIFCFNKKSEIMTHFCKKAPAPKIVQKYIERPLLLNVGREGRKFDIRQWVLLMSLDSPEQEA